MGCGCTLAAASVLCVVVLACITPMFVCHDDLQQRLSQIATFIQHMARRLLLCMSSDGLCCAVYYCHLELHIEISGNKAE